MRPAYLLLLLGVAGCDTKPDNFKQVFDYAKACTDRRTDDLYAKVAVQDVPDDVVKGIIEDCYAEAQMTVGK